MVTRIAWKTTSWNSSYPQTWAYFTASVLNSMRGPLPPPESTFFGLGSLRSHSPTSSLQRLNSFLSCPQLRNRVLTSAWDINYWGIKQTMRHSALASFRGHKTQKYSTLYIDSGACLFEGHLVLTAFLRKPWYEKPHAWRCSPLRDPSRFARTLLPCHSTYYKCWMNVCSCSYQCDIMWPLWSSSRWRAWRLLHQRLRRRWGLGFCCRLQPLWPHIEPGNPQKMQKHWISVDTLGKNYDMPCMYFTCTILHWLLAPNLWRIGKNTLGQDVLPAFEEWMQTTQWMQLKNIYLLKAARDFQCP